MSRLSRRSTGGTSVIELVVAVSLISVLLTATFLILKNSNAAWRKVSGEQDAGGQISKSEGWLRRDLAQAAYGGLAVADSVSTLSGKDGDALWFLSAIDPASGEFIRNQDGTPRWQRNILYYCIVPTGDNPTGHSGGGISENGYEVSQPGKVLIRKVIDSGPPTLPDDPLSQEELLSDVTSYLEAPDGGSLAAAGSESVMLIARSLLSFRALPDDSLRRVSVTLQAAKLEEQQRTFPIGSRSLVHPEYLLERRFEVYPENIFVPPSTP